MKLKKVGFFTLFIFFSLVGIGASCWADSNSKLTSKDIREHEDMRKCYATAHRVCPDTVEISKCLAIKRNAFTSFCVDKLKEKSADLQQMTKAADVSKCTQSLRKECKLELPPAQIKPDKKLLQAAVNKYQQCMNKKIRKNKDCDAATNRYAKEGAKKNSVKIIKKNGQVQLIKN